MKVILLSICICAVSSAVYSQSAGRASSANTPAKPSIQARLAAQNALFEEQYQSDLELSPMLATSIGDYRYNDQLDQESLAANAHAHAVDAAFLARIRALSADGFPEQDQLSHDLLIRVLEQRIADYSFKEFEVAVNQMRGPQIYLSDLPNEVPLDTVKHYEDYIARLHQIPRSLVQSEEVMRAGMKDNLMPVKFLLEQIPAQCDGIVRANPFLKPTRSYPASFSPADRQRLTQAITDAANNEVLPAIKSFAAFVATEYAPHGRTTLAVTSLTGGPTRYQNLIRSRTSSTLTPQQIHAIGLAEIERLEAEMLVIAHKGGFPDVASYRASLLANPKYKATSADQILDGFRRYIAQMQAKLPELFTVLPRTPVTVEAIPAFAPALSTHYQPGTEDGSRPGRVSVQTSNPTQRSLLVDEAVAYHEGIPGHHLQQSVARQLTGLPAFRRHIPISGYTEGWGLYAEQLGKDVGFYQDAASDYGRLSSEIFRAVRLVVDTGIHSEGWSRDQVVAFMRLHSNMDEPLIQAETDRYIALPAQALSYKLGQLKFLELRARAQRELGTSFDLRRFHDEMLSGGVLPFDLLDARTDRWIAAQKPAMAESVATGQP